MKAFEYAAPQTEADAVRLLADSPRAEVLAGGTDLVGLMKSLIVQPDRVVNIMEIDSIRGIAPTDEGGVEIGAAVTLEGLLDSPELAPYQALQEAAASVNSMQLQCQGTIGGDLCQRPRCWFFRNGQDLLGASAEQGDNRHHAILGNTGAAKFVSASRLGPALIALEATLRVIGPGQDEQWIGAADFFRTPRHSGQRETVLEPGQLLTHIVLPPLEGRLSAAYEVKHGCGPEDPMAAAAVAFTHRAGVVEHATIVMGHVAPTPWVADSAALALAGQVVNAMTAERIGELAVAGATPLSNNQHKVQLAKVAVKRALLQAAGLETGGF
ncbi:MAG: FAD binding domain-containing protein [Planctomycetales bacterium]|nr:FAD binding domain-containing protein [Planctomycetales bacterium]